MSVRPEATPNPNALKYTTDRIMFEGTDSISVLPGDVSEHEILNDLMEIDGVDNVFGYQNFITVTKFFDVEWDELNEQVLTVFKNHGFE
ncbi:MAG TPA: NifU N-terminal domain-containing protein [Pseudogracilibacillus sp.]|nr:NifU N-terminal domain-containing protein [Pseudogracilibacillus sp.]